MRLFIESAASARGSVSLANRRLLDRRPAEGRLLAALTLPDGSRAVSSLELVDVSAMGMGVLVEREFPIGTHFEAYGRPGCRLPTNFGRVVHVETEDDGRFRLGLKFESTPQRSHACA